MAGSYRNAPPKAPLQVIHSASARGFGEAQPLPAPLHLIMDGAYDDNQTLVLDFGFLPVVPCPG
jgi:hypothetical protein